MRRYGFFALVYPLVISVSIAMLVPVPTGRFAYHFIAGYVMQLVPALLVALADEMAERKGHWVRVAYCAAAGFCATAISLIVMEYVRGGLTLLAHSVEDVAGMAVVGAAAGGITALAFYPLRKKTRNEQASLKRGL